MKANKNRCPKCQDIMIILELKGVEIDHCPGCGGVWLDSGELEAISEYAGSDTEAIAANLADGLKDEKSKIKCLACGRKLNLAIIGESDPVTLDCCRSGHGIWFDPGELHKIIIAFRQGKVKSDEGNEVCEFLEEVFSKKIENS